VVSVGNSLICYILARWSGCLELMIRLETIIFWLFIYMIMALVYDICCCWMSSVKKFLKWGGDDGEEWCSVLNGQFVTS
jgi:hypothetical protein